MAKAVFIRAGRARGRVDIGIADDGKRKTLSVSDEVYGGLGAFSAGHELSCEELEILLTDDEKYRSMKRALSILAYADNSAAMLLVKLKRAGFGSDTARECVGECVRLGYIDEGRQLKRLIPKEAAALRGPAAIRAKLRLRGYNVSLIDKVMAELRAMGELDFEENLSVLLQKYGDGTDECKKRLMYKHGYL